MRALTYPSSMNDGKAAGLLTAKGFVGVEVCLLYY